MAKDVLKITRRDFEDAARYVMRRGAKTMRLMIENTSHDIVFSPSNRLGKTVQGIVVDFGKVSKSQIEKMETVEVLQRAMAKALFEQDREKVKQVSITFRLKKKNHGKTFDR